LGGVEVRQSAKSGSAAAHARARTNRISFAHRPIGASGATFEPAMAIYRVLQSGLGEMRLKQWRRSALRTLGLLLAALAACAVGLTVLDSSGEPITTGIVTGIWNAANLLTTLGDFTTFNNDQRMFMVVAMFVFISIGGYAISKLTGLLSSEAVVTYRENRILERSLEKMSGHIVVVGFGPLGQRVAAQFRASGDVVLVVERDIGLAGDASSKDFLVVHGDAGADDVVLRRANVASARAMVITIEEPDRKIAITLIARSQNAKLQIIATGSNDQRAELLKRAGASEVVIAEELIASALVSHLAH
jgi:hypothetical protein